MGIQFYILEFHFENIFIQNKDNYEILKKFDFFLIQNIILN